MSQWKQYELDKAFKEKMISGGYCPKCGDFLIPRKIPITHDYGIEMECINPECDFKREIGKDMNFIDCDEEEEKIPLEPDHSDALEEKKRKRELFLKYTHLGMDPDTSNIYRWAETWGVPHSFIVKYPTGTGQLISSNHEYLVEYSWRADKGKYRLHTQDHTGIHCVGFFTAKDLESILDNEIKYGGEFIGGTGIYD
ncbi:MAG: hypothetical protein IJ704_03130 [Bacilli bacterium]|nr:hypothetical protein [Bacilli bacterium]